MCLLGWEDWEFWYWGLLPIGLCVIATLLVHHFYWKNTQDISAPIDDLVKPVSDDVAKPVDEPADDVAKSVDEPAEAEVKGDEESPAAEVTVQ